MATYDTDFVRLRLTTGTQNIPVKALGLEWPPPERLYLSASDGIREAQEGDSREFILVRVSYSGLNDEVAGHPNLARGADYRYAYEIEGATPNG